MRIAIDARPAAYPKRTGIGYYTWQLLRRLPEVDPTSTYVAWYLNFPSPGNSVARGLRDGLPTSLRLRSTPFPAQWFERLSERLNAPRVEWFTRFEVLFAPNFVPPPTRRRRLVVTVHDLAFKLFPDTAPQSTRRWLARLDRALQEASLIIVVSESTRRDLIGLYSVEESRIVVVPHGVDHDLFHRSTPAAVEGVLKRFGITGPYWLCLGGIEPRKNLPRMVEAFARMSSGDRTLLVLSGSMTPWNPEGWTLLGAALDALPPAVRRRVLLTGYVREQDKVALLSGAQALLYPSMYEGFGLPILEAMACGTPVITSNVSALPEVAGEAALLVDPLDVGSIAGAMERVRTDEDLQSDLVLRGLARAQEFDWLTTARRTAEVLHRA